MRESKNSWNNLLLFWSILTIYEYLAFHDSSGSRLFISLDPGLLSTKVREIVIDSICSWKMLFMMFRIEIQYIYLRKIGHC